MIVPLTVRMAAMGSSIGKGLVWLLTKENSTDIAARVLTVAAIYSAVGVRDQATNEQLGKALMAGPGQWQGVRRLRRDSHEQTTACWLHSSTCCLSKANGA
jgi:hypothetical protein